MAILIGVQELEKSFTERPLFKGLSFSIETKERIGLIGPNGAGKSTLLSILAGTVPPDAGKLAIQRGLRVGHLAQVPQFRPGVTVHTAVLEGARDPDDWEDLALAQELMARLELRPLADAPLEKLSGGWKKRVALARELLKQPDLLLLDEPTNDLDMTTLDLLQEVLQEFNGAVLLVTHDRYFLDQVANQIIGFGKTKVGAPELVSFANLAQWEAWHARQAANAAPEKKSVAKATTATMLAPANSSASAKKKLSFKEEREFNGIEAAIATAEARLATLQKESEFPEVATNSSRLLEIGTEVTALEQEIERLYARWAELSERQK